MSFQVNLLSEEEYGDGVSWLRGPLLGSGGFGRVYLASSSGFSSDSRPDIMAVKSAKHSVSDSLQFEKMVFDQLQGCPDHIIRCFGDECTTSKAGSKVYNLLLEFASGGTLSNAIKKSEHGLSESKARSYARSVVNGLLHIHGFGYVHCDIKPENILLVRNNVGFTAKIADLGLAKKSETYYGNSNKRKAQQPRGTLSFLAPEVLIDGVQEAPSDIWALGCVVLEMLTGKPAWGENLTGVQIAYKLSVQQELPIIPSELSKEAKSFLKLCLARNPNERCQAQSLLHHPFLEGVISQDLNELPSEGMIEVLDLTGIESFHKGGISQDLNELPSEAIETLRCVGRMPRIVS